MPAGLARMTRTAADTIADIVRTGLGWLLEVPLPQPVAV
jgi:hypothetical protein